MLAAKLNLVDLAGSERASKTGAQGQQLREGAAINTSLMALGSVINALSEGKFVNYRNSKLTRLLQESLGGNAATVMLAAVSPADYNFDETMSTIRYAQRAKKITNKVTRNEDVHEKVVRELQNEIESLKRQLAAQVRSSACLTHGVPWLFQGALVEGNAQGLATSGQGCSLQSARNQSSERSPCRVKLPTSYSPR